MNHDPFEKALSTLSAGDTLSTGERLRMRQILREYMAFKPRREFAAAASASYLSSLFANLKHAPVSSALAVLLIVSISSASLVSAAEGALPGEFLYGVKVGIVEPVHLSLAQTAETKRAWERQFAERRLSEAAVLADQGRLDKSVEATLTANFEHYSNLVLASSSDETDRERDADTEILRDEFSARLDAYVAVLDRIDKTRGTRVTEGLRSVIETQTSKAQALPFTEEIDEPHTTRLMVAADKALDTSTTLIETLPPSVSTTTSERMRQALEEAKTFQKEGDELLQKKDLSGASHAFKKSLKATSRLSVLTEAATALEIDAFDQEFATTTASSTETEKEKSPDEEDSSEANSE